MEILVRRRFVEDLLYFFNLKSILSVKSVQLLNECGVMLLLAEVTTKEGIQSKFYLKTILRQIR